MKILMKNIFLKIMFSILKNCMAFRMIPFLPERMKIEKVEKLQANLHNKKEYVVHIRLLKQALNHGLIFEKKCIAGKERKKDFFKLMSNAIFWKTMENVRNPRDIKLITTRAGRNYLVLEPTNMIFFFFQKIY